MNSPSGVRAEGFAIRCFLSVFAFSAIVPWFVPVGTALSAPISKTKPSNAACVYIAWCSAIRSHALRIVARLNWGTFDIRFPNSSFPIGAKSRARLIFQGWEWDPAANCVGTTENEPSERCGQWRRCPRPIQPPAAVSPTASKGAVAMPASPSRSTFGTPSPCRIRARGRPCASLCRRRSCRGRRR